MARGLNNSHAMMGITPVADKEDFFKSGLPEMSVIRSLINVASRLFKIPTTNIVLGVVDDVERVYCLTLLEATVHKYQFGKIYYLPLQKRLDIFDNDPTTPLHTWVKKKIYFSRTSGLQQLAETHKAFQSLVNTLN